MPAAVNAALILEKSHVYSLRHGYLLIESKLNACILIIVFIHYLTSRDLKVKKSKSAVRF